MTVKDLIVKLNNYPQDAIIVTQASSASYTNNVVVHFTARFPRSIFGTNKVVFIESEEN